jgi:apolipoprotein D and lipocalin family protein
MSKTKYNFTHLISLTVGAFFVSSISLTPMNSFAADQKITPVTSIGDFNMDRYLGQWYEIARLPNSAQKNCVTNIMSTYTRKSNGLVKVDNECRHADGKTHRVIGEATTPYDSKSQLRITFLPSWLSWISFSKIEAKVFIMLTDYQTSLVGSPDRKYLWIWSRTPQIAPATYQAYIKEANRQGFDTQKMVVNQ